MKANRCPDLVALMTRCINHEGNISNSMIKVRDAADEGSA